MPTKAARSELPAKPVNIASFPKAEALRRAHEAGSTFYLNEQLIQSVAREIWTSWMNQNIPRAAGQNEDEFGVLIDAVMDSFLAGMSAGIVGARAKPTAAHDGDCGAYVQSIADMSRATWHVNNVLTFMVSALDEDRIGALPVKNTLTQLAVDTEKIALSLMDVSGGVRNEQ